MGDILMPNKFGAFYKYLQDDEVTDVDYNGKDVWVKDVYNRRYKVDEPEIRILSMISVRGWQMWHPNPLTATCLCLRRRQRSTE